ncbi:MAG TPA: hemerythrin domain-containing protein [Micromonosporaceae bacterium]|nr:hemerythrin domain-containing protein [Micromonosporaceae bacterium]
MATDAISVIMNDHRRMERLFSELQSGEGDRIALLNEVAARLTAHSHAEEQRVYPAIAAADPAQADEVHHGTEEHHEAEKLLHQLQRMEPAGAEFEAKLNEFIDAVGHHIEEEESEILPALRKAVDQQTLEELGKSFENIRTQELKTAGVADDSEARDDLYARAKGADIAGRGGMKKEQLAEALRAHDLS